MASEDLKYYDLAESPLRHFDPAEKSGIEAPIFILSLMRSGSTLLRCILDSHSKVCAPNELHLRRFSVRVAGTGNVAIENLGVSSTELRFALWNYILTRSLSQSGKQYIVEKTPSNILIYEQLLQCWPRARFLILRRNPSAIVKSLTKSGMCSDDDAAIDMVLRRSKALDKALEANDDSVVVRYEDLLSRPADACMDICEFIGIDYESRMLHYGDFPHGRVAHAPGEGLGDWGEKMLSGEIQSGCAIPRMLSKRLASLYERWGYQP